MKVLETSSIFFFSVGVYGTGPLWGRVVDTRGPRFLLAGAFFSLLIGYSGMRYLYNAAEGSGSTSQLTYFVLVLFSFLTGVGGTGGLSSAVNTTARSFPERRVRAVNPSHTSL